MTGRGTLCRTALGLGLAVFAACETQPGAKRGPAPPDYISLQRSVSGLAATPAYVVTLFEDGRVLFEGNTAVNRRGTFAKTIPREQAQAVFRELDAINFWEREPRYDVDRVNRAGDSIIAQQAPANAPWDIIVARSNGRFKRIDGLFFAPRVLLDLKALIERTTGLAEWLGEPAGTAR